MCGRGIRPGDTRRASQRAVRSSLASPSRGPTSCTPRGRPLAPCMSGSSHRGHPAERPRRAERRVAGRRQADRRRAERRGREDRVVALLEQLGNGSFRGRARPRRSGSRARAPRGRARSARGARREPVAAGLPLAREVERHLRAADAACRSQTCAAAAKLDLLDPVAQLPRPARRRRPGVGVGAVPERGAEEREHRAGGRLLGGDLRNGIRARGRVSDRPRRGRPAPREQGQVLHRAREQARRGRACARA